MYELGLGLGLGLEGPGLGLDLEGAGRGLEGPGLGLEGLGLVNIPANLVMHLFNCRCNNFVLYAVKFLLKALAPFAHFFLRTGKIQKGYRLNIISAHIVYRYIFLNMHEMKCTDIDH